MNDKIKEIISTSVIDMINVSASDRNISKFQQIHEQKTHFVPIQYQVLGGMLQSLNIRIGNFLEKLFRNIVEHDPRVTSMPDSGKRIPLRIARETDTIIDTLLIVKKWEAQMTACQR